MFLLLKTIDAADHDCVEWLRVPDYALGPVIQSFGRDIYDPAAKLGDARCEYVLSCAVPAPEEADTTEPDCTFHLC